MRLTAVRYSKQEDHMKQLFIVAMVAATLAGCGSPPKPPLPTGDWVPVNRPPNTAANQAVDHTVTSTNTR